jgi:hypothetical protein
LLLRVCSGQPTARLLQVPARVSRLAVQVITAVTHDQGQHCRERGPCVQPDGGWLWFAAALLPPSAMSLFAFALAAWTSAGAGVTYATFATTLTPSPHFSVATIFAMLAFDFALYGALTLAVDRWSGEAWPRDLLRRTFPRRARRGAGAGVRLLQSRLSRLCLRV